MGIVASDKNPPQIHLGRYHTGQEGEATADFWLWTKALYRHAGKKARAALLDEFSVVTGFPPEISNRGEILAQPFCKDAFCVAIDGNIGEMIARVPAKVKWLSPNSFPFDVVFEEQQGWRQSSGRSAAVRTSEPVLDNVLALSRPERNVRKSAGMKCALSVLPQP